MKNRISRCIAQAKKNKQKLLCPFITAGYPSLSATKQLIRGFEAMGIPMLELGIPFSDPLADGPVIQETSFEALKKDVSIRECCKLVAQLRKEGCELPIIFFSYINPIVYMGYKEFAALLVRSGVDGVLCPDLPLGVEDHFPTLLRSCGISCIRLIAPNTTATRRAKIARDSDDFIYYVSRKGITGTQSSLSRGLKNEVQAIKRSTTKPVLVGFGISRKEHVREVLSVSDGAIIGSAILKVLKKQKRVSQALTFTKSLMQGIPK
ncbi:MAG: tryptophan synthase subunit alpha [Candidatus Omnitrophica bacterium]|nr:tryptophan synthase subunit alpha [Candidatus Omnitrophota bacterium]